MRPTRQPAEAVLMRRAWLSLWEGTAEPWDRLTFAADMRTAAPHPRSGHTAGVGLFSKAFGPPNTKLTFSFLAPSCCLFLTCEIVGTEDRGVMVTLLTLQPGRRAHSREQDT